MKKTLIALTLIAACFSASAQSAAEIQNNLKAVRAAELAYTKQVENRCAKSGGVEILNKAVDAKIKHGMTYYEFVSVYYPNNSMPDILPTFYAPVTLPATKHFVQELLIKNIFEYWTSDSIKKASKLRTHYAEYKRRLTADIVMWCVGMEQIIDKQNGTYGKVSDQN